MKDVIDSAQRGKTGRGAAPRPRAAGAAQRHPGEAADGGRRDDSAGRHLLASVARAQPEQTVDELIAALRAHRHDCVDIVCVVDAENRLIGTLPLARLLGLAPDTLVGSVADADFPKVRPTTDQERVASLALHHGLSAVPVIDARGRLLGVVPAAALLHILRREHVEDIHRLAGISRETHRAREAIESPPLRRLRHRLPWLLLGLLGSTVATLIMAHFEAALALSPAVVLFVPGLVYLADAIGTQTEAVAVRGLSLSHARLASLIGGEVRTGLLIGLVLGGLTLPGVWLAFGEFRLAAAVAGALVAAGGLATAIGLLLPWLLGRLGSDPAYGSGPLATIVQDLLTLLTYFLIVTAVIR